MGLNRGYRYPLGSGSGSGPSALGIIAAQALDTRPLASCTLKPPTDAGATVAAGATQSLLTTAVSSSYALSGPGTLERIQFGEAGNSLSGNVGGGSLDATITIVADGVTVLQCNLGLFFLMYGYNGTYTGQASGQFFATRNRSVDYYNTNLNIGATKRLMIHFTTSLQVNYTVNASGGTSSIYSGVEYRVGAPPSGLYSPRYNKFHSYTVGPLGSTVISATAGTVIPVLPTQTPGVPGVLDSIQVFILGQAAGPYWLEGHPLVTLDGVASLAQKGTEDFFGSHFYSANTTRSDEMGFAFAGTYTGGYYYTGMFRDFQQQPLFFNNSLAFQMENGHVGELSGNSTVAINFSSLVTWYTQS